MKLEGSLVVAKQRKSKRKIRKPKNPKPGSGKPTEQGRSDHNGRLPQAEPDHFVDIRIPLGNVPEGAYTTRSVEVARMSARQTKAYAMLYHGAFGELLTNGKLVATPPDSMRYLLEQIANAAKIDDPTM